MTTVCLDDPVTSWPRLPLEGATEPHPGGRRIAVLGECMDTFYLYPTSRLTKAEADTEAERVRRLVEGVLAEAAAITLREVLGPESLTEAEEDCFEALCRFIPGFSALAEPEKGTSLDRIQRLPFAAAPWAGGITTGYLNAARGQIEVVMLESGPRLVTADGKRGQLRFATPPTTAQLESIYPGISPNAAEQLAATLHQDGWLRSALIALAAVQFTVLHPCELVEWDDRLRKTLGWKRPGSRRGKDRGTALSESRREFDRLQFSRLRLGADADFVGRAFSHGENAYGEWELYRLGYRELSAEGLPQRVRFDPVGISADMLRDPHCSESLGYIQDILALSETAEGRWATALIVMHQSRWRQRVNKPGKCWQVERPNGKDTGLAFGSVTRAFAFDCVPPDPPQTPEQALADPKHPDRGPRHFDAALQLLIDAKLVDCCLETPTRYAEKHGREPWPHTDTGGRVWHADRSVNWRDAWWKQPIELRPAGKLLAELQQLRRSQTRGLRRGSGAK